MANRFVFGNFISNTSATVGASFMSKRLYVATFAVFFELLPAALLLFYYFYHQQSC